MSGKVQILPRPCCLPVNRFHDWAVGLSLRQLVVWFLFHCEVHVRVKKTIAIHSNWTPSCSLTFPWKCLPGLSIANPSTCLYRLPSYRNLTSSTRIIISSFNPHDGMLIGLACKQTNSITSFIGTFVNREIASQHNNFFSITFKSSKMSSTT